MTDSECIRFMQWALPKLNMRWKGFRKVRGQVRKRISKRMRELRLSPESEYRRYLEENASEWLVLDHLMRITISRFYRDVGTFDFLASTVLPSLAQSAVKNGNPALRCWSAGCASGEEAYSLALVWEFEVACRFPGLDIEIIGTDFDSQVLRRAREGCYRENSVKSLPQDWRSKAFRRTGDRFCLLKKYREKVLFLKQDLRENMLEGSFHLVLCRNLVFTYFEERLQMRILEKIQARMKDGGALVMGAHETLPAEATGFEPWRSNLPVYRRISQRKRQE